MEFFHLTEIFNNIIIKKVNHKFYYLKLVLKKKIDLIPLK